MTIPILIVRHIIDATVKSKGWGLIDIETVTSYRVELDNFEPIFYHDDKMKEFEELLKFRDKHVKLIDHIKVLAYGFYHSKDKDNKIIALVLAKDLTTKQQGYTIIAYDLEKELETLRKFKFYAENPHLKP